MSTMLGSKSKETNPDSSNALLNPLPPPGAVRQKPAAPADTPRWKRDHSAFTGKKKQPARRLARCCSSRREKGCGSSRGTAAATRNGIAFS
jgi:hypothetical protein